MSRAGAVAALLLLSSCWDAAQTYDACQRVGRCVDQRGILTRWEDVQAVLATLGEPPPLPDDFGTSGVDRVVHAPQEFGAFAGAVLLPSGAVLAAPYNDPRLGGLEFSGTAASLADLGSPHSGGSGWAGAVLASADTVFMAPADDAQFLRVDANTRAAQRFGDPLGAAPDKFGATAIGGDGAVYGVPDRSTSIARLDPGTGAVTLLPDGRGGTEERFSTAVLTRKGDLLFIPNQALGAVVVTAGGQLETRLPALTGLGGAANGPDGYVYAVPGAGAAVVVIDVETWTATTVTSLTGLVPGSPARNFVGVALGPDGRLWAVPHSDAGARVLAIEPRGPTGTTVRSFPINRQSFFPWSGLLAHPNGRLYAPPYGESVWLTLAPPFNRTLPSSVLLSPWFNHAP